jgi:hypothetical protein
MYLKIKSALGISVDTQGKQKTAKNSICLVAHLDYGSITSRDKVHGTGMKAIY